MLSSAALIKVANANADTFESGTPIVQTARLGLAYHF
jgi:hypothetical protein